MARPPRAQIARTAVPIEQAVLAPESLSRQPGMATAKALGDLGAGIKDIGQMVAVITEKNQRVKDNQDIARGVAEYNKTINDLNATLPSLDPDDYMEAFDKVQQDIPGITEGMSKTASESLQNKFTVWNEANRASTALLSVKNRAVQAKKEIPIVLQSFSDMPQTEETKGQVEEFINGYSDITSPDERDFYLNTIYSGMVDQNRIFEATNLAIDNPTPENLELATDVIDELSKDEADRFRNLQRIRSGRAQKTNLNNLARKALVNETSSSMGETYSSGAIFQGVVPEEVQQENDIFNARVANGTMDIGDGITYNSIGAEVDVGTKFFSQEDLMSAFASGMSSDEYTDLVKRNAKNAKLTIQQKGSLAEAKTVIDIRYKDLLQSISGRVSVNAKADVASAALADKSKLMRSVKDMVLEGKPQSDIDKLIDTTLTADADSMYKGFWGQVFSKGFYDTTIETREIGDKQDRMVAILQFLKSGDKKDIKMASGLLGAWYE